MRYDDAPQRRPARLYDICTSDVALLSYKLARP